MSKEKLPQLLEKDQLRIVMEQKRAFNELKERKPAFPPTFKFEPGTMDYDMKRRPAWTDRILYKPLSEIDKRDFKLELEQKSYKSHPTYSISDHKPVSSEFTIKVTIFYNFIYMFSLLLCFVHVFGLSMLFFLTINL